MMNKAITYEAAGVKSTVALQEDGFFHELETRKWGPTIHDPQEKTSGARYVNIFKWFGDMNRASQVRYPYVKRHEKLKTNESSVVWVASAGHYMEIRRGAQTKFAPGERRTWRTAAGWLMSLTTPAIAVDEKPAVAQTAPAPAPAPVPAPAAFDHQKFQNDFDSLTKWAREKTTTTENRTAAIIQICHWLLEMKARSEVAAWLEATPLWRVSIRAVVHGMQLGSSTDGSAVAVSEFLKAF